MRWAWWVLWSGLAACDGSEAGGPDRGGKDGPDGQGEGDVPASCEPVCESDGDGCRCTGCCVGTPMVYDCNERECTCTVDGEVFLDSTRWACTYESDSVAYVANVFVDQCGANIDPYASACPD